jgi:hypothetical protein
MLGNRLERGAAIGLAVFARAHRSLIQRGEYQNPERMGEDLCDSLIGHLDEAGDRYKGGSGG